MQERMTESEKRSMEISADAANPFPILHNKLNLEECNMKKKVMITLAALAAAGAAVTGCICLANSKVYGYGRFR